MVVSRQGYRPVPGASSAVADIATAGDGEFRPHPGAFPAVAPSNNAAAAAAAATRLPGLDGPLSRSFTPSAAAVPDLNAIPEDGVLPSGPLPPPAGSAAPAEPLAITGGSPLHKQTAAGAAPKTLIEGQTTADRPAEQQPELPMASGHLPNPSADTPAQVTANSTAAAGEHGQPQLAASTAAADPAAQPGGGLESAEEAHPPSDDPNLASVATVGAAAQEGSSAGGAAQDAPQPAAPAVAAQQPGSAAAEQGGAGTSAAAEAAVMAAADRAVAVEEAMEVRRDASADAEGYRILDLAD